MSKILRNAKAAARNAFYGAHSDIQPSPEIDRRIDAAVLAFVKAMPDWESVTGPATDPVETPVYYRMSVLAYDLENHNGS